MTDCAFILERTWRREVEEDDYQYMARIEIVWNNAFSQVYRFSIWSYNLIAVQAVQQIVLNDGGRNCCMCPHDHNQ